MNLIEYPDRDVLFSPADAEAEDAFANEYQRKIEEIRQHLEGKILML